MLEYLNDFIIERFSLLSFNNIVYIINVIIGHIERVDVFVKEWHTFVSCCANRTLVSVLGLNFRYAIECNLSSVFLFHDVGWISYCVVDNV